MAILTTNFNVTFKIKKLQLSKLKIHNFILSKVLIETTFHSQIHKIGQTCHMQF
jgi:hypothetical protein